jgi:hypothetical protein
MTTIDHRDSGDRHEVALVELMLPARRDRYREQLLNAKHRARFLQRLDHFDDWDPGFVVSIPTQTVASIVQQLTSLGASDACWVVSSNPKLDGKAMELSAALEAVFAREGGTIVSCIPGELVYFEGEDQGRRFILKRTATARRR